MARPRPAPLTVPQPDLGAIRSAVLAALADGDLWTKNRIAAELWTAGISPSAPVLSQVLADLEACRIVTFTVMGDAQGYCLTPLAIDSRYPPHVIEPTALDPEPIGAPPVSDLAHWSEDRRPGPEKPARYATPIQQMTANLAATATRNAADAAILRDLARICPPRIAAVLERAADRLT